MKCACVFSLDDGYVTPFKVFFQSLIATESIPGATPIFILHAADLSASSIDDLISYLAIYGRSAHFLDASSLVPSNLPIPVGTNYTPATYYRLFIADILPEDITHVVYLDADIVAIRSIQELFRFRYETPIAAVDHLSPYQAVRLWGECAGPYFQAGVILISLEEWRKRNFSSLFLSIISKQPERLGCVDQDVLNIAFKDNWTPLPIGFNVEEGAVNSLPSAWLADHIRLAHFSGLRKPWNTFNPSPYTSYWDQAYKGAFGAAFDRKELMPPVALSTRIKHVAKKLLFR